MIRIHRAAALAFALVVLPLHAVAAPTEPPPASSSPEFPRYVMSKIDDLYRGNKSHGVIEMTVQTKHWTRTLSLESWSLGKDFSLVRILAPKKEQGTATLKARRDLFTYLSNTARTIKITAGMMGGSWMGSHFTNDDLVQVSRLSDDYEIKLVFDGDADGTRVYRFSLVPRPNAAVVWGKVEITVRAADLQPLRTRYFDEGGKPVREMESSEQKEVQGRRVPMRVVMRPLDGSDEFTEIRYKKLDFDTQLDEGFFSLQKLKAL